jgi:DMSO/TMAO reductase YedYZ heme-binding membrane subunit
MIALTGHGPSSLWYATRGTGAVALLLLTASVVLGIGETRAWRPPFGQRFAVASLHRTLSLLAMALLTVHIVTTVLDPFPAIGLLAAVVPFATPYRPLWMGLGAIASDLLIALVVTSLVRRRLGYRAWRGVHWFAYACWPVAVLHGLGTGSDTRATWSLGLTLACVAAVVAAVAGRVGGGGTSRSTRGWAAAAVVASVGGLAIWLPQGPLARGWARRAGTPASVLAAFAPAPAPVAAAQPAARPRRAAPLDRPFESVASGSVASGTSRRGTAVIDLDLRLRGEPRARLRVRLGGQPLSGGGLRMTRSAVWLGPRSDPGRYRGRVTTLRNDVLHALVGAPGGHALRLTIALSLGSSRASARVRSEPAGETGA